MACPDKVGKLGVCRAVVLNFNGELLFMETFLPPAGTNFWVPPSEKYVYKSSVSLAEMSVYGLPYEAGIQFAARAVRPESGILSQAGAHQRLVKPGP